MFDENNTIPCLKLILLGTLNVGKTNIALKYVKDEFIDKVKSTIGNELSKKTTIKDGRLVTLVIWDTSGDVIKCSDDQCRIGTTRFRKSTSRECISPCLFTISQTERRSASWTFG